MKLNTLAAIGGAVAAAAIVVGVWVGLDRHWAVLLGAALFALPGYVVAAATAAGSSPKKGAWIVSEVMRGTLIGVNAAINGAVWVLIIEALSDTAPAAIVGGIVGAITLLGTIGPVSKAEVYQGLVGWLNWGLPMSWLIVGLGFLFLLGNLLGHAVTGGKVPFMKVVGGSVDWPTGTFFLKGGWISNLNPNHTAFNMGNFSFIDRNYTGKAKAHEAGHTLNLAAFGWVFHLIGAIDEIILRRQGNAYSERLAESNAHTGGSNIPMWA